MSTQFDKALYTQLGELTAEVRSLRSIIEAANTTHAERFGKLEDRVRVVEGKVDGLESVLDRIRGATTLAKVAYISGGVVGGGATATLVSALIGG